MSIVIRGSEIVLPSRSSGTARSSLAVDCGRSEASLRGIVGSPTCGERPSMASKGSSWTTAA